MAAKVAEIGPVVGNRSGLHSCHECPRRYGDWPAAVALAFGRCARKPVFRGTIAGRTG